jgi:hypothetical protein
MLNPLVRCCVVSAFLSVCSGDLGAQGDADSLLAAQRRVTEATKLLEKAKGAFKQQQSRLLEAESRLTKSQQKVTDDKARLDQARKNLEEARGSQEAAQHNLDEANAIIQRLYKERQPDANSKP